MSDEKEGEYLHQIQFTDQQTDKNRSQIPSCDVDNNDQTQSLQKPMQFSQLLHQKSPRQQQQQQQPYQKSFSQYTYQKSLSQQTYQKSLSQQTYKKSISQQSHSKQYPQYQLEPSQETQQQKGSFVSSPSSLHRRTKKQMQKLRNVSLEFQEKEVRQFYVSLFEQFSPRTFNVTMAVKVIIITCFIVAEALFFRNTIASVLNGVACGLLIILWIIGAKQNKLLPTVFRISHIMLSVIMYLIIMQLAQHENSYETSINALTSTPQDSLTAFSSIIFTMYQVVSMQLEVKWFFKGILFFVIILLNGIILLELDLFSFVYGLIAFILLGILLYNHEIAKKERAFNIFRIAEDLDSLKGLINDILPMSIFIVQRSQPNHSSASSPSINWISSLFRNQRDKKSRKYESENPQNLDQIQLKSKMNIQNQIIETDYPLIEQITKEEENKKLPNRLLQITFANKLTHQDFGKNESSDILQQLSKIYLPKLNSLHNQTLKVAKNEQYKKQPENLLELLSTKLNKSTQELEKKPQDIVQNIQISLPVLPSQNTEETGKQKQESEQQINKSVFTFNTPSKLPGQILSPTYHKTTDAHQNSSEKLQSLHNKEPKHFTDASPNVLSQKSPGQLPCFPSNNILPQETETPKNTKNNTQNIHNPNPSTKQPVIQVHPPSQYSTFSLINQHQSPKQSELSQINNNIHSATTPQFSKPRQTTQNNEQTTEINQLKYKDSLQSSVQPPNNLKFVEEYLNCIHKQGENDPEEKNYDIRLVECRWEGQKSIMVIMNNIDERLMRQRLLQIEQYKDSVIDNISHNLKTPLNCILAPLECVKTQLESQMKNEKPDDLNVQFAAESLKHIGMGINNCQLLLYMINDLIDYSQIIKGDFSFRLDFTAFKLSSVVKALRMLFEDQMKSKKIDFVITSKVPLNEIVLFHDERRLLQILVNLISNSLKYTLKGRIELIIEYPKDELVQFSPNPQGPNVQSPANSKQKYNLKKYQFRAENLLRFILIDTGIGMSAQNLSRLKNMLFKKKHVENNNSNSSGLGLSMCFALIEQVGYQRIYPEIQSQENYGTRFSFTIEQICQPGQLGQVSQTLKQGYEKQLLPPLSSNSILGTASPVNQEYQSLSVIGSKHNSFELPRIQYSLWRQGNQHPSEILNQYNFKNIKTKSQLENSFKNQYPINISLIQKQLINEAIGYSETQHQSTLLSKIGENEEHILDSSSSEEEEEEKIQSNFQNQQQQKQQYLGVYPDQYPKSRQPSFSSSINKERSSFLQIDQIGQNNFYNPITDKTIPSRKNSQNKNVMKSAFLQQQQQTQGQSPSALSNISKDPASFYSSIAQRHNILFGKDIKNCKNDEQDEDHKLYLQELPIEQPKEIYSNKAPPSSPSVHEIDRSYGNSCDCIQEEAAERQDGISGQLEIRKKVFQTFGNGDFINAESDFMQRSQEDYINPETVSEHKSHITTQKYNIVPSASKGNSFPSPQKNSPQISTKDNLRWMLPHLQTEQNIDETIEMILQNKHILIVDDTVYNIMMMKILMRNVKNLHIEEAYNGKDALIKFQEYAIRNIFFDFIFMDIEMPIMNGLECIKNIRQFEQLNQLSPTSIISVTAYEKNLQDVRQAGADELIAKPIRKDKFLQTLRHLTSDNPPPLPTHSSNILLQL